LAIRRTPARIFFDHDFLNCSALHQSGEIVDRCNHLRSKVHDQFKGESTAAFSLRDNPKLDRIIPFGRKVSPRRENEDRRILHFPVEEPRNLLTQ
jgi:hypothetical protein